MKEPGIFESVAFGAQKGTPQVKENKHIPQTVTIISVLRATQLQKNLSIDDLFACVACMETESVVDSIQVPILKRKLIVVLLSMKPFSI